MPDITRYFFDNGNTYSGEEWALKEAMSKALDLLPDGEELGFVTPLLQLNREIFENAYGKARCKQMQGATLHISNNRTIVHASLKTLNKISGSFIIFFAYASDSEIQNVESSAHSAKYIIAMNAGDSFKTWPTTPLTISCKFFPTSDQMAPSVPAPMF